MSAVEPIAAALDARLAAISAQLDGCLLIDRDRLARRLTRLQQQQGRTRQATDDARLQRQLQALSRDCAQSVALLAERKALSPRLEFPQSLPISQHREPLQALIKKHQVVIVSGETGSGKSTQLPKLCLDLGRGLAGRIGHTQPRRIAARAIARRLAEETATRPGELVGHCVRFDEQLEPRARVKVMTDGILLNEVHSDRWLRQYDTLIIDEVHERSLNIDVLLAYLKEVLLRRPELKLIVTSATLDVAAFRAFYQDCASYSIPGRGYPITLQYRPLDEAESGADDESVSDTQGKGEDIDVNAAIVAAVHELDQQSRADILVFLAGEREIRDARKALMRARLAKTEIIELYARLGAARQAKIFQPGALRRIILATNVAETSITVPRVRHVIDTGDARISRYSVRRKLQQLPIEPIARANADQRAGRCGREAPGTAVRLFSEHDYNKRRAAVEPEILRTNLAGVILRLKAMGIADVEKFPFAERPDDRLLKDGYNVLQEIGALDSDRALTAIGTQLNQFPIDPRLARVLLAAGPLGCLREALIITAALSIADPRERPHEKREAADRAHENFADKRSDFLWFVNAWDFARTLLDLPFKRRLRQCRRRFLSALRVQEWVLLHDYLAKRVATVGLSINTEPAGYKAIHSALVAGFPSLVGEWQGDHYLGCRNLAFVLHPSSILHRRDAKWVLAGDIVETARPYARLSARIDPSWVDAVAGHLIRRSYEVPHFDPRRGAARVTEIQRLFGLVLNADRQVALEPLDREAARELFISSGLLEEQLGETPEFMLHNRALIKRITDLESRARRRDLLASRAQLFSFYATRIPATICTRRALLRWLREDPHHMEQLHMDEQHATSESLANVPAYLFPDELTVAGTACDLNYRFEPGAEDDGVTVRLPVALLPVARGTDFDRLVPGLLSAKVEAILRAIPKTWRRQFSPAREFAMAAVEALHGRAGPLTEVLAASLSAMTGHEVEEQLFAAAELPAHLYCRIEVVDDNGTVLKQGRDLLQLQQALDGEAEQQRAELDWGIAGRSDGPWRFGDIAEVVRQTFAGSELLAYPGLTAHRRSVELKVYDSRAQAEQQHRYGVARLIMLNLGRALRQLERGLPDPSERALYASLFGYSASPLQTLTWGFVLNCVDGTRRCRDGDSFTALLEHCRARFDEQLRELDRRAMALFVRGAALRRWLDERCGDVPAATRSDVLSQLTFLIGPKGITGLAGGDEFRYAFYLDALQRRLERVVSNPGKDLDKQAPLAPLWRQYLALRDAEPEMLINPDSQALHQYFEEWRVHLFTPELGVAMKVSEVVVQQALDAYLQGRKT